jgi:hypothetical protein
VGLTSEGRASSMLTDIERDLTKCGGLMRSNGFEAWLREGPVPIVSASARSQGQVEVVKDPDLQTLSNCIINHDQLQLVRAVASEVQGWERG